MELRSKTKIPVFTGMTLSDDEVGDLVDGRGRPSSGYSKKGGPSVANLRSPLLE